MARIEIPCFKCHKNIETEINQTVIDRQLRWYESYRCPFCGDAAEIDGTGFPPDDIRQIILANEGIFCLSLNNFDADKVKAMKIIRQILGLSISAISLAFKSPHNLVRGTKAEMKWIATILFFWIEI